MDAIPKVQIALLWLGIRKSGSTCAWSRSFDKIVCCTAAPLWSGTTAEASLMPRKTRCRALVTKGDHY